MQFSYSAEQMKSMIEVVDELIKNKRGAKKVNKLQTWPTTDTIHDGSNVDISTTNIS